MCIVKHITVLLNSLKLNVTIKSERNFFSFINPNYQCITTGT